MMRAVECGRALLVRSRPRFWLYLAGPVAVGVAWSAAGVGELRSPRVLALLGYYLIPANLYLYGVNDAFDAEIDRRNPKKDGRERRWTGDRLTIAGVSCAGLLGIGLLPLLPRIAWPWHLGFLALATAYSAPPRLKTRPPLDSLSNGLYVMPGAVAYAAVAGQQPPLAAVVGGWLWTMAMHTFSAIPDVEPDREAGIRTTATVVGERGALAYCGVCWLAAAGLMALVHPFLGAVFAVYPVFAAGIDVTDVAIDRAYWWFPVLNTLAGMVLTMGGIWVVLYG